MGSDYSLIYDDAQKLVWLDYTKSRSLDNTGDPVRWWQDQVLWASNLGSELIVSLNSNYITNINWNYEWRLPITDESKVNLSGAQDRYEGPDQNGYYSYCNGYNMVNSEMGYLYYIILGNKALFATDGTLPQPGYGLKNTGLFRNLLEDVYQSGTPYSPYPEAGGWHFNFIDGRQFNSEVKGFALAVHPGEINAVPIPGAIWLLGSGLVGIIGFKKLKGNRRA